MSYSHNTETLGDSAKLALQKHYQKILKHETQVLKDKDPEDLHQMRVGMRRLRTAIASFSQAIILPKSVDEKKVGKVAKILGELRDLDVLEENLTTVYLPELPNSEQKKLDKLLKFVEKQRKKATHATKKILDDDIYKKLKEALENWLEKPIYTSIAYCPIHYILPDLLSPQISAFLLHPGWIVGIDVNSPKGIIDFDSPPKSLEELSHSEEIFFHSLRKEAKRTRYLMELVTDFYGENYQQMLEQIKEVQAVLGEIQDSFVLRQLLTEVYDHDLQSGLPIMSQKIRENRLKNGFQWEELRQFFLATENRTQLRLSISSPNSDWVSERID